MNKYYKVVCSNTFMKYVVLFGLLFVVSMMFQFADARCLGECPNYLSMPRIVDIDGNSMTKTSLGDQLLIHQSIERFDEETYCQNSKIPKNSTIYCSENSTIPIEHHPFGIYYYDEKHHFRYLVEIYQNDVLEASLSEEFIVGFNEYVDVKIPWTPIKEGTYQIQTTVLKSLDESVTLLPTSTRLVVVESTSENNSVFWTFCNEKMQLNYEIVNGTLFDTTHLKLFETNRCNDKTGLSDYQFQLFHTSNNQTDFTLMVPEETKIDSISIHVVGKEGYVESFVLNNTNRIITFSDFIHDESKLVTIIMDYYVGDKN